MVKNISALNAADKLALAGALGMIRLSSAEITSPVTFVDIPLPIGYFNHLLFINNLVEDGGEFDGHQNGDRVGGQFSWDMGETFFSNADGYLNASGSQSTLAVAWLAASSYYVYRKDIAVIIIDETVLSLAAMAINQFEDTVANNLFSTTTSSSLNRDTTGDAPPAGHPNMLRILPLTDHTYTAGKFMLFGLPLD